MQECTCNKKTKQNKLITYWSIRFVGLHGRMTILLGCNVGWFQSLRLQPRWKPANSSSTEGLLYFLSCYSYYSYTLVVLKKCNLIHTFFTFHSDSMTPKNHRPYLASHRVKHGLHGNFAEESSLNKRAFRVITKAVIHWIKVISHHINVTGPTKINFKINCKCVINGNLKQLSIFNKTVLKHPETPSWKVKLGA